MSKLSEIYEGWKNYIFQTPEIEELAKERIEICAVCEYFSSFHVCIKCGCPSMGKARSPESKCPLGKWKDSPPKIINEYNISSDTEFKIPALIWSIDDNDYISEELYNFKYHNITKDFDVIL